MATSKPAAFFNGKGRGALIAWRIAGITLQHAMVIPDVVP
jgi:hypothetical protein